MGKEAKLGVLVTAAEFDPQELYGQLMERARGGAVVTFTGYVRDFSGGRALKSLELEHYPGMTERVLDSLGKEAARRFDLNAWHIVHRYGNLDAWAPIVWVGVVASHRGEAFRACEFMMDTLKTDAPFWKREHFADGSGAWIEQKQSDVDQRASWHNAHEV